MARLQKPLGFVMFILLCTLFSFSLSAEIISCSTIPVPFSTVVWIGIFTAAFFFALTYNKYTLTGFLVMIAVAAAFLAFDFFRGDKGLGIALGINDYIFAQLQFVRGLEPFRPENMLPVPIALVFCFSLIFTVFYRVRLNFLPLFLTGFAVFSINIMMRYHHMDILVMVFLLFAAIICMQYMNLRSKKGEKMRSRSNSLYTLSIIPICALALLAANFLPQIGRDLNRSPVRSVFTDPVGSVEDLFYSMFNPKFFNFQLTGFSGGSSRLGGNVNIDTNNVMKVTSEKRVYLAGEVKSIYTGYSWEAEITKYTGYYGQSTVPEVFEDGLTLEVLKQFYRDIYGPDVYINTPLNVDAFEYYYTSGYGHIFMLRNYGAERYALVLALQGPGVYGLTASKVTVEVLGKRTGSVFFPTGFLEMDSEGADVSLNGSSMRTTRLMDTGKTYSFTYLDLNLTNFAVFRSLSNSKKGFYNELIETFKNLEVEGNEYAYIFTPLNNTVQISADMMLRLDAMTVLRALAARAEGNRAKYTQLPEEIPQRVRDLALSITKDYASDYDKAKSIEAYLRNYSYNLRPGPTPMDVDFVDYFLFEQKEGYCTHFATAFTVLCRAAGLPVRYVEGFTLPAAKTGESTYFVTNAQAHAWPEVYFEGCGWVRFEPTTPYYNSISNAGAGYDSTPEYYVEEELEMMLGARRRVNTGAQMPTAAASGEEAAPQEESTFGFFSMAFKALVVLAVLVIFLRYIWIKLWTWFLAKREPGKAVKGYFKLALYLAGVINRGMEPGETVISYARRYRAFEYSTAEVAELIEAAEVYSKAIYSRDKLTPQDVSIAKNAYEALRSKLWFVSRRYKFFYIMYIRLAMTKL